MRLFALIVAASLLGLCPSAMPSRAEGVKVEGAATAGVGVASPSIGVGLSGIADWSTQQPFIDVMKSARTWTGHLPGRWGGWDQDDFASGGFLDENGWLKSMPKGVVSASTLILTDLPEEAVSLNGRYRLTYKGTGVVHLEGRAKNVKREDDGIWFDFVAGTGNLVMTIKRTDPHGTGDYIRDIEVVKKENIPLHEVGAIFNPDWIARIQDLRLLRFMDWMGTNDSTISKWSERPTPTDFTYTYRGAPVEVMVELANHIGADPWFTLPHLADDDYIRRFAEYVRDNLDPSLKAHVEFSNEVWNWQFKQAQWAEDEAKKRWHEDSKWVEFYGMRAAQMAEIWDEVFGAEAPQRLVKVISTHTGWLGLEDAILNTPLWVAEDPAHNKPAAGYFDAYAVTGYFAGALGGEEKAPLVKKWIADSRATAAEEARKNNLSPAEQQAYIEKHGYDRAVDLAARELADGAVTGDNVDSLDDLLSRYLPYHGAVAKKYGLDLIMYEGGTHVVGLENWVDDPELTSFFIHLNYTPEMGRLYEKLLEGWKNAGGTVFNAFVDVVAPTKWGSWGALRHLSDANPRFDALAAFNANTQGWWEERLPGAFLHGVTEFSSGGSQRLEGTAKADILIGGDGDDTFVGLGGSDRMNGGPGNDLAVLPGRFSDYAFQLEGERLLARTGRMVTTLFAVETLSFSDEPDRRVATKDIQ